MKGMKFRCDLLSDPLFCTGESASVKESRSAYGTSRLKYGLSSKLRTPICVPNASTPIVRDIAFLLRRVVVLISLFKEVEWERSVGRGRLLALWLLAIMRGNAPDIN
jgi:hypothetical protein